MMDKLWNYDMTQAPQGSFVEEVTSRQDKIIVQSKFVPEPCHVLLKGKVYQTWKLPDGRWNGFTKEETGEAFIPFPKVPKDT